MELYEKGYEELRSSEEAISFGTRFGARVKVGFGVVIDENVIIGNDVFIGHNTVIRSNVTIGDGSIIGHLVVVESDTTIGKKVTIQSQCHITKHAKIEDRVFMGPMAMCINTKNISHGRGFEPKLQGPIIGYGARIGSGAILLPGVRIGQNALIGSGAIVNGKIPDNKIFFSKKMVAELQGDVLPREILKP